MLRPVRWILSRLDAAMSQAELETYQLRKVSEDRVRKLARYEALRVLREARRAERRASGVRHD